MRFACFLLCAVLFSACATRRQQHFWHKTLLRDIATSPVFARSFTGFVLLDASSGRELCAVNADRYFTPASNTKILTLAASLKLLGDSLPGLQVAESARGDTLYFRGAADPTFLHPQFQAWQPALAHLSGSGLRPKILVGRPGTMPRYAPGWAWDDYAEDYQAECSALPLYGNTVIFRKNPGQPLEAYPAVFQQFTTTDSLPSSPFVRRAEFANSWTAPARDTFKTGFEIVSPFRVSDSLLVRLLQDTLRQSLALAAARPTSNWRTLRSVPVDTVYRRLMHQSDNFIAEQLLLQCSGALSDTLDRTIALRYALRQLLPPSPTPPRWVDGSGLSRYNLLTPRFLSLVLLDLYRMQPFPRLQSLFPAGGVSGTMSDWYRGPDGRPFVFAKTGSLGGVHCLSGYLVTKQGKRLVFSFMHNNFTGSNRPWKEEMQRLLLEIYARS